MGLSAFFFSWQRGHTIGFESGQAAIPLIFAIQEPYISVMPFILQLSLIILRLNSDQLLGVLSWPSLRKPPF